MAERKMDGLDLKILAELQKRGYPNSVSLAPLLGVAERTVRRRMEAMKTTGIIKIVIVPNPVVLGYEAWATIGIKADPRLWHSVARELAENRSVYLVSYTLGRFDFIIAAFCENINRLTQLVSSELTKVAGIQSTETMVSLRARKYYDFFWPAKADNDGGTTYIRDCVAHSGFQIDDTDRRILNALMEDGLARPGTLKKRVSLGEATIRKRMNNMLRSGVYDIQVVPNPEVLTNDVWATVGVTVSQRDANMVIDEIAQKPEVYLASVASGRFNILLSARFRNIRSLEVFLDQELQTTRGVASIESFIHSQPLKYHNIRWSNELD
jgi:Lrp/AsnC family transcriptional regulator for asnA, asnC and gidA